jgi:YbbR domain-containing protein
LSLRRSIFNNMHIKAAALIVGVIVWLFAKGEQEAEGVFSVPLMLRNMPDGLTTVEKVATEVDVVLEGDNKDLVRLRLWGEPYAVVDMSDAQPDRMLTVSLSPANVVVPRDARVQVLEIRNPRSIDIDIDRLAEKSVAVDPVIEGEPPAGYYILGAARSMPDTVSILGPSQILAGLTQVSAGPLSVEGRRNRVDAARSIVFDERWNLHSVPREVRVIVDIEGTRVATLSDVPAVLERELTFADATMEPDVLELTISGPEHLVTSMAPEDVRIVVDAMGLYRGTHEVVPEVTVPEGVEVHGVTPPRVTVTLQ